MKMVFLVLTLVIITVGSFSIFLDHPLDLFTMRYGDTSYRYSILGDVYHVSGGCYEISCGKSYKKLAGVHAKNFEIVGRLGRYKDVVYKNGEIWNEVKDSLALTAIEPKIEPQYGLVSVYYRDVDQIWYLKNPEDIPKSISILKGEESFVEVPISTAHHYLASEKRVFVDGYVIPELDPATFELVKCYTPSCTLVYKDSKNVYANGIQIIDADANTFNLPLEGNKDAHIAFDKNYVYLFKSGPGLYDNLELCENNPGQCAKDFRVPNISPEGLIVTEPFKFPGEGTIETESGSYKFTWKGVEKIH